ncbi:MAG: hypothetical protein AAB495_00715 [Patescibacteria group bacterium]
MTKKTEKGRGAKVWTLIFRSNDPKSFQNISSGKKWVETRAAIKRYKAIQKGDTIRFVCGRLACTKVVVRVRLFPSIKKMLSTYRIKDIMPDARTELEVRRAYAGYPNYKKKLALYGLIAWELA